MDQYVELWLPAGAIHEILTELKSQNLQINQDFKYAFIPAWENYQDGSGINQSSVRFWFDDGRLTIWFQLKYSNKAKTQDS